MRQALLDCEIELHRCQTRVKERLNAITMQPKICATCETTLPSDAPAGVCPKCLLKAGLDESNAESKNAATLSSDPTADAVGPGGSCDVTIDSLAPETQSTPETGSMIRYFGEYELLEEIARGGMGVVYRARQTRLNRVVALKMILAGQLASDADVRRFQTEAEAAAKLDHPGIVPIFEVGEHDGHHFYSMALVEGESLEDRLTRGPLAPRDAAELIRSMAAAVQHAHEKGVIHRDLKPANVLIDRDGQPRVTDFGLARQAATESGLTATGQVLGTPGYMSPEQASGSSDRIAEATDVYALGAVLYAAVTGRPPFSADTAIETLKQVVDSDPALPSAINKKVDVDLQTIVQKCLEKRPEDRYASATELAAELQRYLTGVPIHARPVSSLQRLYRWGRRRPLVPALIASVCVAVLAIAGLVRQMSSGSPADATLTPKVAGQLVCEAASIPNDEWTAVAGASTMPSAAAMGNRPLSLILFSLHGQSLDQIDPNAADDFQYAEPRPKPYLLAEAIWISKDKGYASFIQPAYVTDCTVEQEAGTAHGTVRFSADDLYTGKVNYVARRREDTWIVEELHMPKLRVSLQRDDDGNWGPMMRAIPGKAPKSVESSTTDG